MADTLESLYFRDGLTWRSSLVISIIVSPTMSVMLMWGRALIVVGQHIMCNEPCPLFTSVDMLWVKLAATGAFSVSRNRHRLPIDESVAIKCDAIPRHACYWNGTLMNIFCPN